MAIFFYTKKGPQMNWKQFFKTNLVAVAAVAITVTTMSFKLAEKSNEANSFADLMWFQIEPGYSLGTSVAQVDATYISTGPTAPSGSSDCKASGSKQCVSGFNATQVNATTHELLGSQTPVAEPRKRP